MDKRTRRYDDTKKDDITKGLDMISTGLLLLESSKIDKIVGKRGVDITAKMNAQYCALEKILKPRKEYLKEVHTSDYLHGFSFKARFTTYWKNFPDLKLIKAFIGAKKFEKFLQPKQITEVSFEVNE